MPVNKKESLIYTMLMCGFMVFIMSVYNVSRIQGFSWKSVREAWIGFPVAYLFAMLCDWFLVSGPAKKIAFSAVGFESAPWKKIFAVSTAMVCGMVIIMSMYGAIEAVGISSMTITVWITNIPWNFIMALPLQLIVAGPFIRFVFRKAFPIGTIVIVNEC